MNRLAISVLAPLNLLLAGLLTWLWIGPDGELRGIHWVAPAAIRPDLGTLSAASIQRDDGDASGFVAILDRPVFSPTRRPPPPPGPPKLAMPTRPDPLDTMHLYGVFSGADGGGLIARVDGKTRRLKISETVGDWRLNEITSSQVAFTKGAERRIVRLVQAPQAAGGAVPSPAFAAPLLPPAPAVPQTPPAATAQQPAAPAAVKPGAAAPNPFVIGGSR